MSRGRLVAPTGNWEPDVEAALAATDWEETPVVDVVTFLPATSRGFEGDQQRVEVYRYASALPLSTYENGERRFRVERLTEPMYRGLRIRGR